MGPGRPERSTVVNASLPTRPRDRPGWATSLGLHIDGDEAIPGLMLDGSRAWVLTPGPFASRCWRPLRVGSVPRGRAPLQEEARQGRPGRARRTWTRRPPRNDHYFNGHVNGKIGVRPAYDVWLGYIEPWTIADNAAPSSPVAAVAPLRNSAPRLRAQLALPAQLERGHRAVCSHPCRQTACVPRSPPASRGPDTLRRVFEETVADDVPSLRALGVLEEIDPCAVGRHAPTPYAAAEEPRESAAGSVSQDKRAFEPERGAAAGRALVEDYPGRPL